jgi:hypothetical protein
VCCARRSAPAVINRFLKAPASLPPKHWLLWIRWSERSNGFPRSTSTSSAAPARRLRALVDCIPLHRHSVPRSSTPPKTAILMAGFQSASGIKVMAQNWSQGLRRFGASALAAPVGALRSLAEAVEAGEQEAPSLRHFVVSFTGGEQGELAEDDRERFWRVFQVPVFEQRLGFDGRVIAYECEAHDGLHIVPERAAIEETAHSELLLTSLTDLRRPTLRVGTRLGGSIQHDCCDCGNAAARLIGARPLPAPQLLAAAAC